MQARQVAKKRAAQTDDKHAQRKRTAAKAARAQNSPAHACRQRTKQRTRNNYAPANTQHAWHTAIEL
eukprot:2189484-Lingulodinium_polyedra.AAC.1